MSGASGRERRERNARRKHLDIRVSNDYFKRTFDSQEGTLSTIDTKERILDAAERLFAEEGFAGTSLRTVTAEAGVNLAAVHYHFGGKDDLIQAVFVRRLGPLHRERLELLDACEAEAAPGPAPVEKLLEAFLGPPLRLSRDPARGGAVFMRLLGRVHAEPGDHFGKIYCSRFSEVMSRFMAGLQRALPGLPQVELYWRIHFLHGVMGHGMCNPSRLELFSGGLCEASDTEAILQRMVTFLAAGLRAPAPPLDRPCNGTAPAAETLQLQGSIVPAPATR